MSTAHDADRVADMWGRGAPSSEVEFFSFPPVLRYQYECITGERRDHVAATDIVRWVFEHAMPGRLPAQAALSLCSGFGAKDRQLATLNLVQNLRGLDISPGAVGQARSAASSAGLDGRLEYDVSDLHSLTLPRRSYDLVYASGALHHISDLEYVLGEAYQALRPGGVLISDEYVGPAYNNLSARHRELINAAVHLLPPRLRHASEETFCPERFRSPAWLRAAYEGARLAAGRPTSISLSREPSASWPTWKRKGFEMARRLARSTPSAGPRTFRFGQVWDISPRAIRKGDPSEGVRADEIIPVIRKIFDETTVLPFNGSLTYYALEPPFFQRFDPSSSADLRLLESLLELERTVISNGEVPSIYAYIVARRTH